MATKLFKCRLLSDVILNQKSASEGPNKTLDFIPGNSFLGIVARHYSDFGEDALEVFHSGKVRFGDAHPASDSGTRCLRTSASVFYPKLKGDEVLYRNFHLIEDPNSDEIKALQLKQCRTGFYDYSTLPPQEVKVNSYFSIKSAYDKELRRSEEGKMFGYEALREGLELFFEVEAESDVLLKKISDHLCGEKRIGRSRSAQYGLVVIKESSFTQIQSTGKPFGKDKNGCNLYTVYADGRLVFIDEFGLPTFRPLAKDLGFEEGDIVWEKSQVRTFQYAPYNGQRQSFDADRCGIEKGSVLVVRASTSPDESKYVGAFRNEGFGKVIYNPVFLQTQTYIEVKKSVPKKDEVVKGYLEVSDIDSPLISVLKRKHNEELVSSKIYKIVLDWAENNNNAFGGESFASQWGTIRSIATTNRNIIDLESSLFSNDKNKPGYLVHGVAKEKWDNKRRRHLLQTFIQERKEDVPGYEWLAVVNLASFMGKLSKK